MADVKDPQKLTDSIARQENAEDLAAMDKYITGPVKRGAKRLYENVMGTKEQNEEATNRMRKTDEKNPDSTQAKVNKALGMKKGGMVSSASKRADGCCIKGKTKGRMV
jgi:hypothetical protein